VDSGDLPIAFKKHRHTRLPSPLGALRGSGGLLEFLWHADHQTLGGVSTKQYAELRHISRTKQEEGVTSMFARVVECQSKVGRSEQVGSKLKNDILPILQKQPDLESPPTLETFAVNASTAHRIAVGRAA
jgi:hypothetical protein